MKSRGKRFDLALCLPRPPGRVAREVLNALRPVLPEDLEPGGEFELKELQLMFNKVRSMSAFEEPPAAKTSSVSAGHEFFGTKLKAILQEVQFIHDRDGSSTAAQLTLVDPERSFWETFNVSANAHVGLRELFWKHLAVEEDDLRRDGVDAVRCSGSKLADIYEEFCRWYGLGEHEHKSKKEIGDHLSYFRKGIEINFPRLIVGTPNRGFYLNTHPSNVRFIAAPDVSAQP